jgi:hypothetical protein
MVYRVEPNGTPKKAKVNYFGSEERLPWMRSQPLIMRRQSKFSTINVKK